MPPEILPGSDVQPQSKEVSPVSSEVAAALRPDLERIFDLKPGQKVEILTIPQQRLPTDPPEPLKAPQVRERIGPRRRRRIRPL